MYLKIFILQHNFYKIYHKITKLWQNLQFPIENSDVRNDVRNYVGNYVGTDVGKYNTWETTSEIGIGNDVIYHIVSYIVCKTFFLSL